MDITALLLSMSRKEVGRREGDMEGEKTDGKLNMLNSSTTQQKVILNQFDKLSEFQSKKNKSPR